VVFERDIFVHGIILTVGHGVLSLQGMLDSFVGEVFNINLVFSSSASSSSLIGVSVNLYRDSLWNLHVGGLVLGSGPSLRLTQGTAVSSSGRVISLLLGEFVFGRSLLDSLGNVIISNGLIDITIRWLLESPAASVIERQSVFESLQTGVICLDAIVPVGRGQRELILGDRETGKSSISLDTILNQQYEKVICVYVPVGQKSNFILESYITLVSRDSSFYVSLLVSGSSEASVLQYVSPYSGASVSEFFMFIGGQSVFLCLDDLSKHAVSFREISLLLRRPPGREAYPGEIFFVHSRLLERSSKLSNSLGGGSITSFPVIETLAGDLGAYIATNVISITDGQILLSQDLYNSGFLPPVDVGLSVTRVGSSAQWDGMKLFGNYKLELAQFAELQSFSQFSSDLPEETRLRLDLSRRVLELLKQRNGSPLSLMVQLGILSSAPTTLLTNRIDIGSIRSFLRCYRLLPSWIFLFMTPRSLSLTLLRRFAS
jgi:F-type H+-transporting ATPase subunit alpha